MLANVPIEAATRQQVDRPTKDAHKFIAHDLQRYQTNPRVRVEIDYDVDITFLIEVGADGGTEYCQLPNGVSATEVADRLAVNGDLRIHG